MDNRIRIISCNWLCLYDGGIVGFKKIRYNAGDGLVKLKIEDASGARIENWTIMLSDLGKMSRLLCKKYGVDYNTGEKDKDLDWAM